MGKPDLLRRNTETIVEHLFLADQKRVNKLILGFTDRISKVTGTRVYSYRYQGSWQIPAEYRNTVKFSKMAPASVPPEMEAEASAIQRDYQTLVDDMASIRQLLTLLLEPCMTTQEMRDALPDCLAVLVPDLKSLSRRFEEAWSIRTDPRAMRAYTKLLPKIQAYAAGRLLY